MDTDGAGYEHDGTGPLHRAEPTGDDAVDEALATLERLGALPVREHVPAFDAVHRALSDRLAE